MYFPLRSSLNNFPSAPGSDRVHIVLDKVFRRIGRTDYSTVAVVIAWAAASLTATFLGAGAGAESEDLA